MTRLPLDELTNHLAKVQSDVEKWAQQTSSGAAEKREQHLQNLQNTEATVQDLERKGKVYEVQAQELHRRIQDEQAAEQDELEQLQAFQAIEALMPTQLQSLQQLVERETAGLEKAKSELDQQAVEIESKLAHLRVGLERFRSHLGLRLDFEDGSEELRLIFTHINPANWSELYCVTVRVMSSGAIEAVKCQPPLDEMDILAGDLQRTQNLSNFVRRVRKGFVQLTL